MILLPKIIFHNFKYFNNLVQLRNMKIQFNDNVKGMKVLNRDLFKVNVELPAIKIEKTKYTEIKASLKKYVLESITINKSLYELNETDPLSKTHKLIILDSDLFKLPNEDLSNSLKAKFNLNIDENLVKLNVEIGYENFKFDDIIKAILPDSYIEDNISVKGFSVIGHIAHFNLRNEILEYKNIIGEILLDKIKQIKTVVNKVNEIDNTYRNFKLEILAGESNTLVKCKENNCEFTFDFANVYWNPRLSTEHERVLSLLKENDIVYDVFAGVGPFSVPAAVRKYCIVLANDLNPNSYKYLVENYERNKSKKSLSKNILYKVFDQLKAHNLDGNQFIREPLKEHLFKLIKYINDKKLYFQSNIYVLMNLPAMSIEFLPSFKNLFTIDESKCLSEMQNLDKFSLNLICYTFCRNDTELDELRERICKNIFNENLNIDIRYVRKVAPNKEMYCVRFQLKISSLFSLKDDDEENPSKKIKLDILSG